MKIYDEVTMTELPEVDLTAGYTYQGCIRTGEKTVILEGTVTARRPEGLRRLETVYEDCLLYHAYTAQELEKQQNGQQPSQLDRVEAQAVYTAMMTDTLLEV